ncbi:hypothetical protein ACQP2T_63740 (plasmid) [Nonomuraea sp. CA-143628]|uniref:hypothetical protein n=1 Tax=Nonomuraea sp. CA-143628 TaxID=3239997 RepID=UPI003D8A27E6
MAQTSHWLTVSEAAARLDLGEHDVLELAWLGILPSRLAVNAREVLADAVTRLDEQIRSVSKFPSPTAGAVAENATRPTWTPWIDPDFSREQADYDTNPNDEGDDEQ